MADLIDRQALLSRLSDVEKMPEFLKRSYMDTYVRMEWLVDMIKQLPSATEETFEWCNNCKEYDQSAHCCHRWTKVIRNTVEEIKNEQHKE